MEIEFNYADIVKKLLGDENYLNLLNEISKETKGKNIAIENYFFGIFNNYCLMILNIALGDKFNIKEYRIKLQNDILKIDSKKFADKYRKYIKIIENKMVEVINKIT